MIFAAVCLVMAVEQEAASPGPHSRPLSVVLRYISSSDYIEIRSWLWVAYKAAGESALGPAHKQHSCAAHARPMLSLGAGRQAIKGNFASHKHADQTSCCTAAEVVKKADFRHRKGAALLTQSERARSMLPFVVCNHTNHI